MENKIAVGAEKVQPQKKFHKYLDEIGVDYNFLIEEDDSRMERFNKQKSIFGFDERETWGLDFVFCCWLYERLKMYVDVAIKVVDLTYHKFSWDGAEYSQLELINILIKKLEEYFSNEELDNINLLEEIGRIWAILLPAMWW